MAGGPPGRRLVLLGAGMGLGLALLETGRGSGWLGGATAMIGLVPVALALVLGGPPAAGLAGAVAVGAALGLTGSAAALVVLLRHVLPGAALGLTLARRLGLSSSLILVSTSSLLGLALLVWTLLPAGASLGSLIDRQVEAHVGELGALSARLGFGGDPGWAAESGRLLARMLRVAAPSLVLVGLFFGALANYVVARLLLRGEGFRPFAEEAVPDHVVWGVIAGGLMLVSGHDRLGLAGVNLLIVLTPLYVLQGLAVLRHLFVRVRVPRPLQIMSFGLLVLQPALLIGVACVGLSDLWVDFRKIRQAPTPA